MHPKHLLCEEDYEIIRFWMAYRRDSMGSLGPLPMAGGYGDQPAALLGALEAMNGAAAEVRKEQDNHSRMRAEREAKGRSADG